MSTIKKDLPLPSRQPQSISRHIGKDEFMNEKLYEREEVDADEAVVRY
jgi:hypothetical protein